MFALKTVTINAAFLREIKQDNRQLRDLLEHTDRALSPRKVFRIPPRKVARLLAELRDQLSMHFALEEMYGYFDDAVAVAPRLSAECEALREEHVPLFLELCDIVEQAERIAYEETSAAELRRVGLRFRAFLDQLLTHEAHEIDLILQAHYVDLGAGD